MDKAKHQDTDEQPKKTSNTEDPPLSKKAQSAEDRKARAALNDRVNKNLSHIARLLPQAWSTIPSSNTHAKAVLTYIYDVVINTTHYYDTKKTVDGWPEDFLGEINRHWHKVDRGDVGSDSEQGANRSSKEAKLSTSGSAVSYTDEMRSEKLPEQTTPVSDTSSMEHIAEGLSSFMQDPAHLEALAAGVMKPTHSYLQRQLTASERQELDVAKAAVAGVDYIISHIQTPAGIERDVTAGELYALGKLIHVVDITAKAIEDGKGRGLSDQDCRKVLEKRLEERLEVPQIREDERKLEEAGRKWFVKFAKPDDLARLPAQKVAEEASNGTKRSGAKMKMAIEAVEGKIESLETKVKTGVEALQKNVEAIETRVKALGTKSETLKAEMGGLRKLRVKALEGQIEVLGAEMMGLKDMEDET